MRPRLAAFLFAVGGTLAAALPEKSARGTLAFSYSTNVTRVTFDNPPINLYTRDLCYDLRDFLRQYNDSNPEENPSKVVIFDSADPDFWLDHWDLTTLTDPSPASADFAAAAHEVFGWIRNLTSVVFIAEINGLATGVGDEFLTQLDMRFAGPNARAGQLEAAAGVIPGAGGAQAVPRLIGPGRGLQYLLSSETVDGPTGASIGWFNEYYNTTEALRLRVNSLAAKIALYPVGGLAGVKKSVMTTHAPAEAFGVDFETFSQLASTPIAQQLFEKIIELSRNQTRGSFELGLDATATELYD